MSFLSGSSRKRKYENNHQGSNYYKREGFFSRMLRMFGSYSNSHRRYKKYYSYSPEEKYHYDERRHPPREYRRKRYKSSWS